MPSVAAINNPSVKSALAYFDHSGIAVDNYENLYVANVNDTVLMFPKGKLTASKTYKAGIWSPFGVAVGNDGTVYVSNTRNNANGFVSEYRKGSLEPSMTIRDFAGGIPLGLTTDEKNNLLVTYTNSANVGQVNKYAPGSKTGKNLGIILKTPYFLTLDGRDDYVIAQNRASTVAPLAMAFNSAENLSYSID